ncbi:hypothetical protein CEXT_795811 [Caerostris extrusa]|uniref:Uncharacterized protein n=1 Tax=Caerostris extrusa TaxID=172846 RepID=A0AAV4UDS1_CAEEX|nr:hypothetical protein CEXT_795811 [Caerostris extrusa]
MHWEQTDVVPPSNLRKHSGHCALTRTTSSVPLYIKSEGKFNHMDPTEHRKVRQDTATVKEIPTHVESVYDFTQNRSSRIVNNIWQDTATVTDIATYDELGQDTPTGIEQFPPTLYQSKTSPETDPYRRRYRCATLSSDVHLICPILLEDSFKPPEYIIYHRFHRHGHLWPLPVNFISADSPGMWSFHPSFAVKCWPK